MSKKANNTDVEKTTVKKTKAIPKEFLGWVEVRNKINKGISEWVSFKEKKTWILSVLNWELKEWVYTGDKAHWETKTYIETDKGKLACGARMLKQLLPFAEEDYKGKLIIEAEGEKIERYYYVNKLDEFK